MGKWAVMNMQIGNLVAELRLLLKHYATYPMDVVNQQVAAGAWFGACCGVGRCGSVGVTVAVCRWAVQRVCWWGRPLESREQRPCTWWAAAGA